jgi:hypothetical protein
VLQKTSAMNNPIQIKIQQSKRYGPSPSSLLPSPSNLSTTNIIIFCLCLSKLILDNLELSQIYHLNALRNLFRLLFVTSNRLFGFYQSEIYIRRKKKRTSPKMTKTVPKEMSKNECCFFNDICDYLKSVNLITLKFTKQGVGVLILRTSPKRTNSMPLR